MLTWQGLEKTCIGIYFSDQIWIIKTKYLGWSTLKSNYYQTSIDFEFKKKIHMVQYVVYYNFHVYKFGFYSHKNMLWLFEWKQSRVLGFVGRCSWNNQFSLKIKCENKERNHKIWKLLCWTWTSKSYNSSFHGIYKIKTFKDQSFFS
jgi:hypothetical protein